MRACAAAQISPSHWLGGPSQWDWADRQIVLAWRRFEASQLCVCGTPLALHTHQEPRDFETGFVACPGAEQVARARADYAASPQGKAETEAVQKGAADPRDWRHWIRWPAGSPPPDYAERWQEGI